VGKRRNPWDRLRFEVRDLLASVRRAKEETRIVREDRDSWRRRAEVAERQLKRPDFRVEVEGPLLFPAEPWAEAKDRAERMLANGIPVRVRFRRKDEEP
jgi:hypothetical protein